MPEERIHSNSASLVVKVFVDVNSILASQQRVVEMKRILVREGVKGQAGEEGRKMATLLMLKELELMTGDKTH